METIEKISLTDLPENQTENHLSLIQNVGQNSKKLCDAISEKSSEKNSLDEFPLLSNPQFQAPPIPISPKRGRPRKESNPSGNGSVVDLDSERALALKRKKIQKSCDMLWSVLDATATSFKLYDVALSKDELALLGDSTVPVAEKYLPLLDNHPEYALLATAIMVFAPRILMKQPAISAPSINVASYPSTIPFHAAQMNAEPDKGDNGKQKVDQHGWPIPS